MGINWVPTMATIQDSFALPAENARVMQPDLQGVTTSGLSFKMARGQRRGAAAPEEVDPEKAEVTGRIESVP